MTSRDQIQETCFKITVHTINESLVIGIGIEITWRNLPPQSITVVTGACLIQQMYPIRIGSYNIHYQRLKTKESAVFKIELIEA